MGNACVDRWTPQIADVQITGLPLPVLATKIALAPEIPAARLATSDFQVARAAKWIALLVTRLTSREDSSPKP